MANNDELFDGVAFACDVQTAFGTINSTVAALSGALVNSDGIVLGDKNSGDAESGITIPNITKLVREVAQVQGSFTQSADEFVRAITEGLAISFPIKGNAAVSTPSAGQAKPFKGLDALWTSSGFIGANGTSPVYEYTPSHSASSTVPPVYLTIKLWLADLSWVFQDCIVESMEIAFTAGGNAIATANIKVGSINAAADGVTFPTFTWQGQLSLASPVVEGVAFATFGQTRGFEDLTVTIAQGIEEFGDSNVDVTGTRQSQTDRLITVDGRIYVETADSDAAYTTLISAVAPTNDLSFQLGTIAGATDTINALKVEINNLQNRDIKYDRTGSALVVELSGAKATGLTAGSEAMLTFN